MGRHEDFGDAARSERNRVALLERGCERVVVGLDCPGLGEELLDKGKLERRASNSRTDTALPEIPVLITRIQSQECVI